VCVVDLYSQEQLKEDPKRTLLRIALSILVYIECESIRLLIEQSYNPTTNIGAQCGLTAFYGHNMTHIELFCGST